MSGEALGTTELGMDEEGKEGEMGSPTLPCCATPQFCSSSGALCAVQRPSTTAVVTADIEIRRRHCVDRTTRGPDLWRGATWRANHKVLVMAQCLDRLARALVTRRPSGTAEQTAA
eukprot:9165389-Pyramimonas_sp.AAC.1